MTREAILTKAIQKAIKGGWNMFGFLKPEFDWNVSEQEFPYQTWLYCYRPGTGCYPGKFSLNDILFSRDFARAFYGEGWHTPPTGVRDMGSYGLVDMPMQSWEYYVIEQVRQTDLIKYLEKHL